MDPYKRHRVEKLAAASGVVTAIGGAAFFLSKRHSIETPTANPQPAILNSDQLSPYKRELINRTALSIICLQYPDRKKIMADLEITKHKTDFCIGYLKHYGLIARIMPGTSLEIPPHYQPLPELVSTLDEPEKYPYIEQAVRERIARQNLEA